MAFCTVRLEAPYCFISWLCEGSGAPFREEGWAVSRPGKGAFVSQKKDTEDAFRTVATALEQQIRTGTLAPGSLLPSRETLAEQFGTSLTVIDTALTLLANQQWLTQDEITLRSGQKPDRVADQRTPPDHARPQRGQDTSPRPRQPPRDSVHASGGEPLPIGLTRAARPSSCVTSAYDYEDMHHLVDRLTPTQVRRLCLLVTQDEELSQVAQTLHEAESPEAEAVPEGLLALIGSIDGPVDLGERHDDYIRERMRERFGDSA